MLELTKDFILDYNMLLARGKAHEKNIFVFDETIIGCNPSLPLVIGERKESTGRNNNVVLTTQPGLGSAIPFSMVDGSTPFVFLYLGPRNYTNPRLLSSGCIQKKKERSETLSIEFFYTVRVDISQSNCSAVLWMSSQRGGPRFILVSTVISYVITLAFTAMRR